MILIHDLICLNENSTLHIGTFKCSCKKSNFIVSVYKIINSNHILSHMFSIYLFHFILIDNF